MTAGFGLSDGSYGNRYTKQSTGIFSAVACQNNVQDNILYHGL